MPFVTCEDNGLLDSAVRPLLGKRVRLQAGAQGVLLSADDSTDASAGGAASDGAATAAAHPASADRAVTKARSPSVPWSVIALAGGASLPSGKAACQFFVVRRQTSHSCCGWPMLMWRGVARKPQPAAS